MFPVEVLLGCAGFADHLGGYYLSDCYLSQNVWCANHLGGYRAPLGSWLSEDTVPCRVDGVLRNLSVTLSRGLQASAGCVLENLCAGILTGSTSVWRGWSLVVEHAYLLA